MPVEPISYTVLSPIGYPKSHLPPSTLPPMHPGITLNRCIPVSCFLHGGKPDKSVKLLNRLEVFDPCISFTPTNYCTQSESCRRTVTFPTACDLPSFEQLALASGRLQAWTGQVVDRATIDCENKSSINESKYYS